MSEELPPPDLMDSTGRLRRLAVAFVCGVVAAAITYKITDGMAHPETTVGEIQARGAFKFVGYMTGLVGGAVFTIALVIQNHLAKKAYRASLGVAPAKVVERKP